jgi:uncharacterized membrane protein
MIKKLKGWYDRLEVRSKILVNLFLRIVYFILLVLLMHALMPDTEKHTVGFRLIIIVIGAVLLTIFFDWKKLKAVLKKAEGGREK